MILSYTIVFNLYNIVRGVRPLLTLSILRQIGEWLILYIVDIKLLVHMTPKKLTF